MAARRCTQYMYRWAAEPARERLPHSVTLSLGTWKCGTGACTSRTPPPSYDVVAHVGYDVVVLGAGQVSVAASRLGALTWRSGDSIAGDPEPGEPCLVLVSIRRQPDPEKDQGIGCWLDRVVPERGHRVHSHGRTSTCKAARGFHSPCCSSRVPGQLRKAWLQLQQQLQT